MSDLFGNHIVGFSHDVAQIHDESEEIYSDDNDVMRICC